MLLSTRLGLIIGLVFGLMGLCVTEVVVPLKEMTFSAQLGKTSKIVKVFVASMTVGVPRGKEFDVLIDTTSPDVWLFGQDTQAKSSYTNAREINTPILPNAYNYLQTPSFESNPQNYFNLLFPEKFKADCYVSTVRGNMFFETFKLGKLIMKDYMFAVVNDIRPTDEERFSHDFSVHYPMHGVLGLGFSKYTSMYGHLKTEDDVNVPSVFARMTGQGLLGKHKVFSLYFRGNHGEIVFGGINASKCTQAPHFVPLLKVTQGGSHKVAPLTWSFEIAHVIASIRGKGKTRKLQGKSFVGILDSSSDVIRTPREFMGKLVSELISGGKLKYDAISKLHWVACADAYTMPRLDFTVEGKSGPYYMYLDGIDYFRPSPYFKDGYCRMMLEPSPLNDPEWTLGLPFLRRYVTIYDQGEEQIGFATKKHRGGLIRIPEKAPTPSTKSRRRHKHNEGGGDPTMSNKDPDGKKKKKKRVPASSQKRPPSRGRTARHPDASSDPGRSRGRPHPAARRRPKRTAGSQPPPAPRLVLTAVMGGRGGGQDGYGADEAEEGVVGGGWYGEEEDGEWGYEDEEGNEWYEEDDEEWGYEDEEGNEWYEEDEDEEGNQEWYEEDDEEWGYEDGEDDDGFGDHGEDGLYEEAAVY